MESKYILDTISNEDYYILVNGDSKINYDRKTNTIEKIVSNLKECGVEDLEIIRDEASK